MYRNLIYTLYGLWTLASVYSVMVDGAELTPKRYLTKNSIVCTSPNNCYMRNHQNAFVQNNKKISVPSKDTETKPIIGNSGTLKRPSSYVRFGKRFVALDDLHSLEKRASSYIRFGKRDEILGRDFWRKLLLYRYKKLQDFSSDELKDVQQLDKRPSSYVRFGKRPSSYVRFGKRSLSDDTNNEYNSDTYEDLNED